MRKIFSTSAIGICFLCFLIFSGCRGNTPASSAQEHAITVTDFRGKTIQLPQPAQRVVCLIESALSGIYMLGAQESVVAVPAEVYRGQVAERYASLDARIANKELPAPGNWDFISLEQIVALKPDLVIIWASQTDAIANIERLGIPVYAVMLHSFEDVYKEIRDFGILLNQQERADYLIQHTQNALAELKAKNQNHKNHKPQRAYFMWAQGINHSSGQNSTVNQLLQAAGAINVVDMPHEHLTVNVERIIEWNPDLIVMWYNDKLTENDVINHPLLQGINATKDKRVHMLPTVFDCDLWTLKMQHAVKLVANWAHGSDNTAFDEAHELNQMYRTLYNIE